MLYFKLFLLSLSLSTLGAYPTLKTKQDFNFIRFLSSDGKVTYYERPSGALVLAKNYDIKKIYQASPQTRYTVVPGPSKRKVLIAKDESYHQVIDQRKSNEVFLSDFASTSLTKISSGHILGLFHEDRWGALYQPRKSKIELINTNNPENSRDLSLTKSKAPFFYPQIVSTQERTWFYTDLDKSNHIVIKKYDSISGKSSIALSPPREFFKAYLFNCQGQPLAVISSSKQSKVYHLARIQKSLSSFNKVTLSALCHKKESYWVLKDKERNSDLFSSDLKNFKSFKKLTSDGDYSSVLALDDLVITPHRGKYKLVAGQNKSTNDSLEEKP